MALAFDNHLLDLKRRELRRGGTLIKVEPQVFDLLAYVVQHRHRVIGKDELFDAIWRGRIVSEAALTTRINAVRKAIGDNGIEQRLLRTLRRKGFRFVGEASEEEPSYNEALANGASSTRASLLRSALLDSASVTVQGFSSITGDLEEQWFAKGLAEDVVVALSRYRWLTIYAPNTPQTVATNMRPEIFGRYVVQGSVHRRGQHVRITVHLVDTSKGSRIWTERFNGVLAEDFRLQDKVASVVAGSVEPKLLLAESNRVSTLSDKDITPYALRSLSHPIFSNGKENVLRSLTLLERAILLDPNYGPALADAANCRQILDVNGWAEDREFNRSNAIDLAKRALQLSDDPEPVAISAFVLAYFGEDIDAAAALIDNALALNPSFATGWYMSGMTRLYAGNPEQAIEYFETSVRLNPRDRVGRRNIAGIAMAHFFNRNFDVAASILRPVIHEFPRWATPYCVLAASQAHLGFLAESEATAKRLKLANASPVPSAIQFRDSKHRELLLPGLKLTGS